MSRITTYMVLEEGDANMLAREVDRMLRAGWQLQGGVSITTIEQDGDTVKQWYAQAMISVFDTKEQQS